MRDTDDMVELLLILLLLFSRRSRNRNKKGMNFRTDVILTLNNQYP